MTREARKAGLVTEDADGNATRLSGAYVYGFDGLMLVIDAERVSTADRAELVASAARDTDSIHRGGTASIATAGNGYQIQLPGCRAAGFNVGDEAPVVSRQGLLIIEAGTQGRLAGDLATIRDEQTGN